MVLKRIAVETQNSIMNPINTQYLALHPPEARPVPVLGEVPLPLDGEAAVSHQRSGGTISEPRGQRYVEVKMTSLTVSINFQLNRTPTFEVSILLRLLHCGQNKQ